MNDGNAYFQIQATRPQTIAYALTDSPTGQLAWIIEKFKEWPHHTDVPTGVAAFAEETNTITRWTDFDTGGHFASFETPDLLVDDVRQFFRGLR